MSELKRGSIERGYVIVPIAGVYPLAVFTKKKVAQDYLEHECNDDYEIKERTLFVWDDERASIFDTNGGAFIWALGNDYMSGPTQKEKELRANIAAKLTDEEREHLGWPSINYELEKFESS